MRTATVALCVLLAGAAVLASGCAEETETESEDTVVCDKKYTVIASDGLSEVGTYGIKCVLRSKDQKYEIVESVSMAYRGNAAEYKSTVIYGSTMPPTPERGSVETKIDGRTCMQGTVTVSEKTVSVEGTGFLDKRTGQAFALPRKFGRKDMPRPKGVMLFQSAFPTIGPKLLPKAGELKDVVLVEFPVDFDVPVLVNFKKGCRLVRGKADENGEYELAVYGGGRKMNVRFDKDDQITAVAISTKWAFREIEE